MARPARWYEGVGPVTSKVECGGALHRVTWRRGKVKLEDHDLTAELAMKALGADPCACLMVLEWWRDAHRGSETSLVPAGGLRGRPGLGRVMFARARAMPRQMLRLLHPKVPVVPDELAGQLDLTACIQAERLWWRDAHWRYEGTPDTFHEIELRLRRLSTGAAVESMRSWCARLPREAWTDVTCEVVAPTDPAALTGWIAGGAARADLRLPLSWLVRVHAWGVALVDGCFVLEVTDGTPDDGRLSVRATRWERRRADRSEPVAAPAIARRDDGGTWRLAWV